MGAGLVPVDPGGMPDVRRALPATPIAALVGVAVAIPWLGASTPWTPVVTGSGGLIAGFTLVYRLMASWTERARRIVGYLAAIVVALVVGCVLGMFAMAVAFCGWSTEGRCFDETLLEVLAKAALTAPTLVIGLYAVVDLRTHPRRRGERVRTGVRLPR